MNWKRVAGSVVFAACFTINILPVSALAASGRQYEIALGDQDYIILEIEQALAEKGLLTEIPDGLYGETTQQAIAVFAEQSEISGEQPEVIEALIGETPETYLENELAFNKTLLTGDFDLRLGVLKRKLMELGYVKQSERITSMYDTALSDAVSEFARDHGYDQYMVNPGLVELVFSGDAEPNSMKSGDVGTDVSAVQAQLADGFLSGNYTDGLFDSVTEQAVIAFQEAKGLEPSGVVDYETYAELFPEQAEQESLVLTAPEPIILDDGIGDAGNTGELQDPVVQWLPPDQSTIADLLIQAVTPLQLTPNYVEGMPGVASMIDIAMSQIGKSYVLGAEGPDTFDCSGFVHYVLESCGMELSRTSAAGFSGKSDWTLIGRDSLVAGDLVFFYDPGTVNVGHTGIYLGGNKYIHASSSAGAVVISDVSDYFNTNFVCARRVFE